MTDASHFPGHGPFVNIERPSSALSDISININVNTFYFNYFYYFNYWRLCILIFLVNLSFFTNRINIWQDGPETSRPGSRLSTLGDVISTGRFPGSVIKDHKLVFDHLGEFSLSSEVLLPICEKSKIQG